METVKLAEIRSAEPFTNLFPIAPAVLARVQEDMEHHGFDASQPIILWAEEGVVVDGHTRLEAAKNLALEEVPVYEKNFADEDAALEYAIHNQGNLRDFYERYIPGACLPPSPPSWPFATTLVFNS